jgi:hypothetical protein
MTPNQTTERSRSQNRKHDLARHDQALRFGLQAHSKDGDAVLPFSS